MPPAHRLALLQSKSRTPEGEDGVAKVLPVDARVALIEASRAEPWERMRSIGAAVKKAKTKYPQFFR